MRRSTYTSTSLPYGNGAPPVCHAAPCPGPLTATLNSSGSSDAAVNDTTRSGDTWAIWATATADRWAPATLDGW